MLGCNGLALSIGDAPRSCARPDGQTCFLSMAFPRQLLRSLPMARRNQPAKAGEEWLSASSAIALLKRVMPEHLAAATIASRANDGMIRSHAQRLIVQGRAEDDVEVPAAFWWARGGDALKQNWTTGDFETWVNTRYYYQAYGVSFLGSQIESLLPHLPSDAPQRRSSQKSELFSLKPGLWGMSVDLKELWRQGVKWWRSAIGRRTD